VDEPEHWVAFFFVGQDCQAELSLVVEAQSYCCSLLHQERERERLLIVGQNYKIH
jgi:hypothetical protein